MKVMMKASFFCAYLTEVSEDDPWRGVDHDASKLTKLLKGKRPFNGYVTPPGTNIKLYNNAADRARALPYFAKWAAARLSDLKGQIALVPVPGSDCDVMAKTAGVAADLADAIVQCLPTAKVVDVVRFTTRQPSSSTDNGTRDEDELLKVMTTLSSTAFTTADHVVIIDDVCTTGGHARAVSRRLLLDFKVKATRSLFAGRTMSYKLPDPFKVADEDLP